MERSNARLDASANESNRLVKSLTNEYETTNAKLSEAERANDRLKKDYNYLKVCDL